MQWFYATYSFNRYTKIIKQAYLFRYFLVATFGMSVFFATHFFLSSILTYFPYREQKFNAHYGATFGLKPTLLQSNYYRPQPKSKSFDNLYYAGSSIHPGAGVPIVLTSAMLAVEEIKKDEQ